MNFVIYCSFISTMFSALQDSFPWTNVRVTWALSKELNMVLLIAFVLLFLCISLRVLVSVSVEVCGGFSLSLNMNSRTLCSHMPSFQNFTIGSCLA